MYSYISKRGVLVVVVFLLALHFVSAFGISSPYITNDTINVNPGKDYIYTLTVQNGDDNDYFVNINHTLKDIVSIDNDTKYVYSKSYNTTFNFKIVVPEDTPDGTVYSLEYTAKPILNNDAGMISFGVEIKHSIKIRVTNGDASANLYENKNVLSNIKIDGTKAKQVLKYIGAIFAIVILVFIVLRIWKLSHGISTKLGDTKSEHTISDSKTIKQLYNVIKKMSDDEFDLPIIRNIFKEKISKLNESHNIHASHMTRKQVLEQLKKLTKNE